MLTRGEFAQRGIAKGIALDPRKDSFTWGIRVKGAGADKNKFADVVLDAVIRELTQEEVEYWGKGKIKGGWKLTVPGIVQYLSNPFGGLVGTLEEDIVIVRGDALDETKPRPVITNAEIMEVAKVHKQYQSGLVQEYWLFVGERDGGPTRA